MSRRIASHVASDVAALLVPPLRVGTTLGPRDLVALLGLVLADDVVPAERAPMVVEAVVHALRDLVPGDVEAVTAQLPDGLRGTWAA